MKATVKKTSLVLLMSFGMLLLNIGVHAQSQKSKNALKMETNKNNVETLQLEVKGMSCQAGCANGIDKMLSQQEGIVESKTTFASSSSEIRYDKSKVSEKDIIALIEEKRGFKVKAVNVETLQLKVKGMTCQAGCANGIDKMLGQQKGVVESKTTFASSSSEIKYDRSKISEKDIVALIEERGFKTEAVKEE